MKQLILIILFLAIFLASALFFSQNDSLVTVDYILSQFTWPLNWLMIFLFVVGFLLGSFSMLLGLINTRVQLAKAKRLIKLKEKEINNLRSLPISDEY
ncbi:MAG: lipopolysaccharide assembly protein LapA domain-containing protein [Kangiellaceae bacterium]